jgi:hypothetical protein
MNICYFVLLYHKFEQARRLIRRLSAPNVGLVIHVDASANPALFDKFRMEVSDADNVFFARRAKSRWGSFNVVRAIANCIDTARANFPDFERCVLLSGQDYPVKKNVELKGFFNENRSTEFIEAYPIDASVPKDGWSPYYRFRRHHIWLGRRRYALPLLTKSTPDFALYHGSSWWALTREAIEYIDHEFKIKSKIYSFFETSFLSDEACINTLLMNSSFAGRVARRNVTYTQWTPTSGPHPKILVTSDYDDITRSEKLFARKFDEHVDSKIMDRFD